MKKVIIVLTFFVFGTLFSQDCKVLVKEISDKYEGQCKKNKAHGKGEAWGKNAHYKGSFKKGVPHGEGTFTFENGDVYSGEFKKGRINGKGELTLKETGEVKKGYFKKGNYVGVHKYPYKVISQTGVRKVDIRKNSGNINQVKINIFSNGVPINPQISVNDANNSQRENRNGLVLTNVQFPLERVELTFMVDSFTHRVTFAIYNKANWQVNISL